MNSNEEEDLEIVTFSMLCNLSHKIIRKATNDFAQVDHLKLDDRGVNIMNHPSKIRSSFRTMES